MMASAFAGYDLAMEAYKTAKKEKYKFLTYGDAMLHYLATSDLSANQIA